MRRRLELLLEREGERLHLSSPEVGLFTRALPRGALLAPSAFAGVLHALGRPYELVVPAGARGRVANAPPELVLAPVDYGTRLYELSELGSEPSEHPDEPGGEAEQGGLVFRAPYSGRFWQRPSPRDPPFVQVGDVVCEGHTIGLIEVMKTFTQLLYTSAGELPARARIVRLCAPDGAEVGEHAPLIEVEPA